MELIKNEKIKKVYAFFEIQVRKNAIFPEIYVFW